METMPHVRWANMIASKFSVKTGTHVEVEDESVCHVVNTGPTMSLTSIFINSFCFQISFNNLTEFLILNYY